MSLTTGHGPLAARPAGRFSARLPDSLLYVEPHPRRVRGLVAGRAVVDSERVLLVHRQGQPPTYAFPAPDVLAGDPAPEPAAAGYVRVPWDDIDEWYEEEERVLGHPRNPYHRVDCLRGGRSLRVEVAGVVLVDTTDTTGVYETALAPRLYVSPERVRGDLLRPSGTTSYCAYKGVASYWDAVVADVVTADVAWSYEDPRPECGQIAGMLSFDETRTALTHSLPPPAPLR
ncbi:MULTISPECIES: DUF427 domain-containing protein [unclassified Frankia]|uniref:DUF427 domain-containing protein n=1 Tax=unclassified Frankia TaxID=2632575 RepID=UPI00200D43D9|nr:MULTISPECIES: DUF427 domain-containing protein [unclassified Frankia]MCK9897773.1 DUF427 domain-containing protein [Frankia sp. AgB32]MCL9793505.1 DUF427 domain-containing protein [Frankia sp. AgKG'84/4]